MVGNGNAASGSARCCGRYAAAGAWRRPPRQEFPPRRCARSKPAGSRPLPCSPSQPWPRRCASLWMGRRPRARTNRGPAEEHLRGEADHRARRRPGPVPAGVRARAPAGLRPDAQDQELEGPTFYRPSKETEYVHIDALFGEPSKNVIDWDLIESQFWHLMRVAISVRESDAPLRRWVTAATLCSRTRSFFTTPWTSPRSSASCRQRAGRLSRNLTAAGLGQAA